MEILNGIAFNPQPTARKSLFCTLVVLSRTQSAAADGTRTRPQISTCPFQFCDESIKKLEITKETSTVIVGFDETRFQPKEISSE